jgi:diadenosine tetraphosphatase ApaH/serine/threonine PP2A family protein phosphatase
MSAWAGTTTSPCAGRSTWTSSAAAPPPPPVGHRRSPPPDERDGVALYHGSARDPVWEYVLSDEAAAATLALSPRPLVLVGHSHVALEVAWDDDLLTGGLAPAGTTVEARGRVLLNPGSVGQPRDGDPRAAYLLLDLDGKRATFHRTDYDVERTQAEMRAAGLPEALAARLTHGE